MTRSSIAALTIALSLAAGLMASPVVAVDSMPMSVGVDLISVRAKIKAQNYQAALVELRDLAKDNQQADVYNLLGFVLRKTGDYTNSLTYYTKAIELQPDHKGAHEYLGELFLQTGKPDKAREQLAVLARLCPTGCEERADLEKAIAAYRAP